MLTEKISIDDLRKCIRPYGQMHPTRDHVTVMGVDTGAKHTVVVRRIDSDEGTRPLLYAGKVDSFDDLDSLMTKYAVRICVIDAMPYEIGAIVFQSNYRLSVVVLAYYVLPRKPNHDVMGVGNMVYLGRSATFEKLYQLFRDQINTFDDSIEGVTGYFDQLRGSGGDSYVRAENYCMVAADLRRSGNGKTIDQLWIECLEQRKILREYIDAIVEESEIEEHVAFGKEMTVSIKLPNGFVVSGTAGVADISISNRDIGYNIAFDRAVDKIWMVEGYRLQTNLE